MLHGSKPHSYEKLFYWSRVLQEFARLTKNSWAGKRVCIDLFAGCGIYRDIETHELGWGSPLLALHAIDPFDVYIFGDRKPKRAEALATRVEDTNLAAHVSQLHLDDPDLMHAVADFKALQAVQPAAPPASRDPAAKAGAAGKAKAGRRPIRSPAPRGHFQEAAQPWIASSPPRGRAAGQSEIPEPATGEGAAGTDQGLGRGLDDSAEGPGRAPFRASGPVYATAVTAVLARRPTFGEAAQRRRCRRPANPGVWREGGAPSLSWAAPAIVLARLANRTAAAPNWSRRLSPPPDQ